MPLMKKVLYVEDNPVNRKLVSVLLEKAGYQVLLAEDGIQGIDVAKESEPDLILMDMNMPGMDGYEASTRIKAAPNLAAVPIVAVTANVVEGARQRSLIAGCDGYIAKPINPRTFISEIEEYLRGKHEAVDEEERNVYLEEYSQRLVTRLEDRVRALSVALEEAEEGNRLKSQFLETMSHELRTPLTIITTYAELMNDPEGGIPADMLDYIGAISESADSLLHMVNSVLELCQIEAGKSLARPDDVELEPAVTQISDTYRARAEARGLVYEVTLAANLPASIEVDDDKFRQVLEHLLDNAVKFTKEGSVSLALTLAGPEHKLSGKAKSLVESGAECVLISVTDTGIGIDARDHKNLFRSFRQLDTRESREYGGAGIGLALSRHIAEMHGGDLWLESEPGKGSVFYALFPVKSRVAPEIRQVANS